MATGGDTRRTPRRPRIERLLERRWQERILLVAAPGGCGKSTALRRAVEHNRAEPRGVDIMVTVDSAGGFPGLVAEIGRRIEVEEPDTVAVAQWIARQAPRQVSILIDDLHKLDSPKRLLEFSAMLPGNGHLVLAGRGTVTVPGARVLDEETLAFDEQELEELAATAGVEAETLSGLGGWPAGVDLAATSGRRATDRRIAEDLLAELEPDDRRAVEAVALVGRADDGLLSALGIPATASDLAFRLPLMRIEDGEVVAHDLLSDSIAPSPAASEIRRRASELLVGRGDIDRAAGLLADSDDWEGALDLLATTSIGVMSDAGLAVAERWLGRVPAPHLDHPTVHLFQAVIGRRRDPSHPAVQQHLSAAISGFRVRAKEDAELSALTMLGYLNARVTGDLAGLADVHTRIKEIHSAGCEEAAGLAALGDAVIQFHLGLTTDALQRLEMLARSSLTPEWQGIADWYHAMTLLDLGRAEDAAVVGRSRPGDSLVPFEQARVGDLWPRWAAGDVVTIAAELRELLDRVEECLPRERLDTGLYAAGLLSAAGDRSGAARGVRIVEDHLGQDDPIVRGHLLVARAYIAVELGDEATAKDVLRERFPDGYASPAIRRDILRLMALPYVTDPASRAELDAAPWPGCWNTTWRLARTLVATRNGESADWADVPWSRPGVMVASVGLRWSLELTARARQADHGAAAEACAQMLEWFPVASIRHLVDFRDSDDPALARGAAALLSDLPAPPAVPLRVEVLGATMLRRGGAPLDTKDWRRERVRALMTVLVMEREASREQVADRLWPDLSADRALGNLRVTLNYLNGVLDPNRPRNAAGWTIRSDSTRLRIVDDDYISVDLWEFDALASRAESVERDGDPIDAVEDRLAAVALWRGDPFTEVMYEDWALPEIDRLRRVLLRQLVRSAEVLPIVGRTQEAIELANRALALEPAAENAARALVAAHLARDDIGSARAAYRSALVSIEEMGFAPEAATVELGRRLGVV